MSPTFLVTASTAASADCCFFGAGGCGNFAIAAATAAVAARVASCIAFEVAREFCVVPWGVTFPAAVVREALAVADTGGLTGGFEIGIAGITRSLLGPVGARAFAAVGATPTALAAGG